MPEHRPKIPAEMRRAVLVEAGHRCAIHTCRHTEVDLHHIEPWAKIKEHTFDNLIALCPNCHRLVEQGRIDKKSLREYKARLAALGQDRTTQPSQSYNQRGWDLKSFQEDDNNGSGHRYSIGIEYPAFKIEPASIMEDVNSRVYSTITEEVMCFRGASVNKLANEIPSSPPFTLIGRFHVVEFTCAMLSLRMFFRGYHGGAYSNNWYRCLTLRLMSPASIIQLHDLFTEYYRGLEILTDYCKQELSKRFGDSTWLEGARPSSQDMARSVNFNIDAHGISVAFDEHVLGGKALGYPVILIPYSALIGVLKPGILNSLGIEV